ncbi:hypothetical protein E5Q_03392 [Mixia osmundae IAM 14324]|uniref:Uncharacterized protein n=1 Tax=Mixia osmundae (strain CBS 9802 / IAM 14324 / JCM 22182 / KY 12970) TaxID=764103 RepID=G7E1L1_MIXOS|nr:hypothetical protein E5Q_03392 [Mixia osmundae IAM 14324]
MRSVVYPVAFLAALSGLVKAGDAPAFVDHAPASPAMSNLMDRISARIGSGLAVNKAPAFLKSNATSASNETTASGGEAKKSDLTARTFGEPYKLAPREGPNVKAEILAALKTAGNMTTGSATNMTSSSGTVKVATPPHNNAHPGEPISNVTAASPINNATTGMPAMTPVVDEQLVRRAHNHTHHAKHTANPNVAKAAKLANTSARVLAPARASAASGSTHAAAASSASPASVAAASASATSSADGMGPYTGMIGLWGGYMPAETPDAGFPAPSAAPIAVKRNADASPDDPWGNAATWFTGGTGLWFGGASVGGMVTPSSLPSSLPIPVVSAAPVAVSSPVPAVDVSVPISSAVGASTIATDSAAPVLVAAPSSVISSTAPSLAPTAPAAVRVVTTTVTTTTTYTKRYHRHSSSTATALPSSTGMVRRHRQERRGPVLIH